jgi:hypothetical protein
MFFACILWGSNPRALECAADLKPAPLDHSGKNAWMGALKKLSSLFLVDFGKMAKDMSEVGFEPTPIKTST